MPVQVLVAFEQVLHAIDLLQKKDLVRECTQSLVQSFGATKCAKTIKRLSELLSRQELKDHISYCDLVEMSCEPQGAILLEKSRMHAT